MIYELKDNEFEKTFSLFKDLSYNLTVDAIIEGNRPGKIYVDNMADPKTAFAWAKSSEYALVGSHKNDAFNLSLQRLIAEKITQETKKHNITFSVLFYYPDIWNEKIDTVLRNFAARKSFRWRFTFRKLKVSWKDRIPSGYNIERIDKKLLKAASLRNVDRINDLIVFKWGSIDDFLREGFGFYLVNENNIVSWCISGNNCKNKCEITIGTHEKTRNRGFATLVASAFAEYCVSEDITPSWHCGIENLSSIAVAEKVGFQKSLTYPVFTWEPKKQPHSRWPLKNKPKMIFSSIVKFFRHLS
jgi:RimJ/RimL family protein N-acetyltransferase